MMKKLCITLLVAVLSVGAMTAQTFQNPLTPRMADGCVAKFGNFYYLVGTPCPGDLNMQWTGVWKSRDLVNWSGPYLAFEGDERDRPMWASEIVHKGEQYYIITTCNTWQAGCTMMLQKAPTPLGPYVLHSHLKKKGLDPNIFVDTDGRSYLLDSEWIAPMNSDWNWLDGEFLGHRDTKEGPFMVKNNNRYLRFYARIDDNYTLEMESYEGDNPYTDDYRFQGEFFKGVHYPGHGCVVASPDGTELWYASHWMTQGWESRKLSIDRFGFDEEGMPIPSTRKVEEQPVPSYDKQKNNIAPGKPANSSQPSPLAAFDGKMETCWQSGPVDQNGFLELDLMGEFAIDQVQVAFPQKSTFSCQLMASCDRLNWRPLGEVAPKQAKKVSVGGDDAFCRYLRLKNFDTPNVQIAEVQVFQKIRKMPMPTGRNVELNQGDSIVSLKRGQWYDYPVVDIPATGRYDVVFSVRSLQTRHNRFSLYFDEQRVCDESVAHTGVADNWAQIIAFDTHLEAGQPHRIRLVADEGDFEVKQIKFIEIE